MTSEEEGVLHVDVATFAILQRVEDFAQYVFMHDLVV